MAGGKRVRDPETIGGLLGALALAVWLYGFWWASVALGPPQSDTSGLLLTFGMATAAGAGYFAGRLARTD